MAERSLRSIIAELHQHDCTMPIREMARRTGCDEKYVRCCLSQLGRHVGQPGSDKPEPAKNTHNLFEPWKPTVRTNQVCQYLWLDDGKLQRCYAETGGKTYCADCEAERANMHAGSRFHSIRNSGKWSHMA